MSTEGAVPFYNQRLWQPGFGSGPQDGSREKIPMLDVTGAFREVLANLRLKFTEKGNRLELCCPFP